ncbi:MAG TPA: hypothetical protein VGB17_04695 [Pyrinomonadaceae bacterium]|jgi:hypothetical protein
MSEQVYPGQAEEKETSGLLLSVEPLQNNNRLNAQDGDSDATDTLSDRATDTDASDGDGGGLVESIKDAVGMDEDASDTDGSDAVDTDGTDAGASDADGTDLLGGDSDGTDSTVDADSSDAR